MSDLTEQAVISSLLTDTDAIATVYEKIKPDMFDNALLREAYTQIIRTYDMGDKPTILSISQKLESESVQRETVVNVLKGCLDTIYSSTQIKQYSEMLIADYKTRCLRRLLLDMAPVL